MNLPTNKDPIAFKIPAKTCNCCGEVHGGVPEGAPLQSGLWWWNCQCGSTMVVKEERD